MKMMDGDGKQAVASASLIAPSHVVRVDLGRLDELMRIVGEMVMSRSHLEDHLERLEASCPAPMWRALQETSQAMERHLRGLHEQTFRIDRLRWAAGAPVECVGKIPGAEQGDFGDIVRRGQEMLAHGPER